jgi:hypothetical protein
MAIPTHIRRIGHIQTRLGSPQGRLLPDQGKLLSKIIARMSQCLLTDVAGQISDVLLNRLFSRSRA